MAKIEVSYDDLEGVPPEYTEALRNKEHFVRQAVAIIGRNTSVRWVPHEDAQGHLWFRLTAYSDRSDCIAKISSLDVTLTACAFEELIALGKQPRC